MTGAAWLMVGLALSAASAAAREPASPGGCRGGACETTGTAKANDPETLTAQADALVEAKRPGEAIALYRRVAAQTHSDGLNAKLAIAEAQRQNFLATCESTGGDSAMKACFSAWLAGAPDEFAIYKRRGVLLQEQNQPARALDAFIAADRGQPGDRAVELSIVALSDSTGRKDAIALGARGAALLALNRPTEALKPLRAALRLNPHLIGARANLLRALARTRIQSQAMLAKNITQKLDRDNSVTDSGAAGGPAGAAGGASTDAKTNASNSAARYSNASAVTRSN